ncbi:MAG TPA: pyridoxal phosphate-dependent aminotransferase [Candidatus Choladousia intestinigallinarum]|nr:pyridoxal phosphate-dependent aminotransferase [Candidatus Choladousia intestinigallinarum]
MVNQMYKNMLSGKSIIREQSEFATELGKKIGYENVFDYSLGNPSVPVPQAYTETMIRLHQTLSSNELHGYSPSLGNTSVREKVAAHLKGRFGIPYETKHIFMTSGAAGAIAHAVRCVTEPGDKLLTFAPFFPEYHEYVEKTGTELVVVPADTENFQVNFEAFEELLTPEVQAVLINTPNNPSGIVYSEATIQRMTDLMRAKQEEFGHDIFLISDEPYREIVFDGKEVPYPAKYYDNTLTCYSFSKSMSIPGERLGYVAVNPKATDADILAVMCGQISRGIGHNCPPSSVQLAVAEILDQTSDLSVYEKNMNLLYDELVKIGFEVVRPGGTFYIFPKALEEDANAFCIKARKYNLILVPSDSFAVKGYFRMAYCIDTEKVLRSFEALEAFAREEYGMKF